MMWSTQHFYIYTHISGIRFSHLISTDWFCKPEGNHNRDSNNYDHDADVLIYNGTIEGELTSIDELVKKNSLFADFQAVKSGQVYTTGSNFYQQSTGTCDFIEDLNQILTGEGDGTYRFLKKLQ